MADYDEKRVWGIHTPESNLFLQNSIIAISWTEMGNLTEIAQSREAFKLRYASVYPKAKKGGIATGAGMLFRFVHEMQVGDYVVFPSKSDRMIYFGVIEGNYVYAETASPYVQQRKVRWIKHLPRTSFTQGALHEIGSALTLFLVKNYADEFLGALDKKFKGVAIDDENEYRQTAADIIESTKDYILKELSRQLKGYDLEEFVAALLRAMGYRATVSPRGGDNGIDITAYKDELPPRILVQVKSQDSDIKEATIQSLRGAMREGDYGLFVTLSDYTKNAKKYLQNTPIIRGISGGELVDLILKYYEDLPDKYKRMIPLQKAFIPVPSEEMR